jgi:hypothetical protein
MELEIEVKKLVAYIKSCGLQIPVRNPPHEHVGSIIADAVLQVRFRWKTHVGPRLERMRDMYPNAATISGLSGLLKTRGAQELLNWHGEDEIERFRQSINFFKKERVETFDNLREWLESDNNRDRLVIKIPGNDKAGIPKIGNATADYYRVLVGLPDAVKVDSLVRNFLTDAGLEVKKYVYEELRSIVQLAAKQLGKRPIDLDGAIWNYEEKKNKGGNNMANDKFPRVKKLYKFCLANGLTAKADQIMAIKRSDLEKLPNKPPDWIRQNGENRGESRIPTMLLRIKRAKLADLLSQHKVSVTGTGSTTYDLCKRTCMQFDTLVAGFKSSNLGDQAPVQQTGRINTETPQETKHCIICGEKIPRKAIFCSECGEKQ